MIAPKRPVPLEQRIHEIFMVVALKPDLSK